jgi:nucleoid DNA-binding protein
MLYQELVARIAEVTRTQIECGDHGEVGETSFEFRCRKVLSEATQPELVLHLDEKDYKIIAVDHDAGTVTLETPLELVGPSAWEIYNPSVSEEAVRRVLLAFPDIVMECEEGEQVKTYLGTFRMKRRKRKRVKDPQGRWTYSEEKLVARIRPGKRLQKSVEGAPSGASQESDSDPLD